MREPRRLYVQRNHRPTRRRFWRKNLRDNGDGTFGVDLNRNYGYFWGNDDNGSSPNPNSQTYRGPEPFSEPETRTMRDFVQAHDFFLHRTTTLSATCSFTLGLQQPVGRPFARHFWQTFYPRKPLQNGHLHRNRRL
ncbi:MAG: hypothetical protein IPH31_14140 [Lewinellaceae bacterium]|nr:hypothetical protein [Lewinellaceae bacterium]